MFSVLHLPRDLTVIDEAYFDYVEAPDYPDGLEFLRAGKNVLILRTFSKIHGLAGLRIGFGITAPDIARALEAMRSPFNTSSIAQAAALAALEDGGHVLRSRSENAREARFMQAELTRRRIDFVPTVANFLLMRTGLAGETLYQGLLDRGVIVRPMVVRVVDPAVRVSFGTHLENEAFLRALDEVMGDPPPPPGTP